MTDKRSRTDLELFLLVLVERGIATPYEFLRQADLSPGATLPVLKRLQQRGLVRRGETGSRRRGAYELTTKGQRHLTASVRTVLNSQHSEIDRTFRVVVIALLSGVQRDRVGEFLRKAAEEREQTSRQADVPERPPSDPSTDGAGWYRWMKGSYTRARLDTEANLLLDIAHAVARPGAKKR